MLRELICGAASLVEQEGGGGMAGGEPHPQVSGAQCTTAEPELGDRPVESSVFGAEEESTTPKQPPSPTVVSEHGSEASKASPEPSVARPQLTQEGSDDVVAASQAPRGGPPTDSEELISGSTVPSVPHFTEQVQTKHEEPSADEGAITSENSPRHVSTLLTRSHMHY